MQEFTVTSSTRYELIEITEQVKEIVSKSSIKNGFCLIFVPHSTSGLILTEDEEGLKKDFLKVFEKLTSGFDFRHNQTDDNADSHILAAIVGQGQTIPFKDGKLILGTWQQIFLAEFDGPRTRRVIVQINQ